MLFAGGAVGSLLRILYGCSTGVWNEKLNNGYKTVFVMKEKHHLHIVLAFPAINYT